MPGLHFYHPLASYCHTQTVSKSEGSNHLTRANCRPRKLGYSSAPQPSTSTSLSNENASPADNPSSGTIVLPPLPSAIILPSLPSESGNISATGTISDPAVVAESEHLPQAPLATTITVNEMSSSSSNEAENISVATQPSQRSATVSTSTSITTSIPMATPTPGDGAILAAQLAAALGTPFFSIKYYVADF